MNGQKFPQSARIKSAQCFRKVFQEGQTAAGALLVVHVLPNQMSVVRLGVTIPKKAGNSPQRNYWKRLIREAFRTQRQQLPGGWDLVVRPRKDATPSFPIITDELSGLTRLAVKRFREKFG